MIGLDHTYDDAHIVFTATSPTPGLLGRMFQAQTASPDLDTWAASDAARCDGLGALRLYGETHPDTVRFEVDRIIASHGAIAALTVGQARSLGLPGRPPFALAADTNGVIGSSSFALHARWIDGPTPRGRSAARRVP